MTQPPLTDAFKEGLTLYALGLLDPQVAEEVEARIRAEGMPANRELRAIEQVLGLLGHGAPAVQPQPQLRQRLFERIAPEPAPANDRPALAPEVDAFLYLRRAEGDWVTFRPGVSVKTLSVDPVTQRRMALVRMDAGTALPPHRHIDVEEVFVLAGDCQIEPEHVLYAGDYFKAEAGSWHDMTVTQEGTTFLTLFRNEFFDELQPA